MDATRVEMKAERTDLQKACMSAVKWVAWTAAQMDSSKANQSVVQMVERWAALTVASKVVLWDLWMAEQMETDWAEKWAAKTAVRSESTKVVLTAVLLVASTAVSTVALKAVRWGCWRAARKDLSLVAQRVVSRAWSSAAEKAVLMADMTVSHWAVATAGWWVSLRAARKAVGRASN